MSVPNWASVNTTSAPKSRSASIWVVTESGPSSSANPANVASIVARANGAPAATSAACLKPSRMSGPGTWSYGWSKKDGWRRSTSSRSAGPSTDSTTPMTTLRASLRPTRSGTTGTGVPALARSAARRLRWCARELGVGFLWEGDATAAHGERGCPADRQRGIEGVVGEEARVAARSEIGAKPHNAFQRGVAAVAQGAVVLDFTRHLLQAQRGAQWQTQIAVPEDGHGLADGLHGRQRIVIVRHPVGPQSVCAWNLDGREILTRSARSGIGDENLTETTPMRQFTRYRLFELNPSVRVPDRVSSSSGIVFLLAVGLVTCIPHTSAARVPARTPAAALTSARMSSASARGVGLSKKPSTGMAVPAISIEPVAQFEDRQ